MSHKDPTIPTREKFTMIPNMIDDLGLSVYAVRLYLRIKRRVGELGGACWESTKNLAAGCSISAGSIVKAKKELQAAGLIKIKTRDNPHGGRPYHEITVVDIWEKNAQYSPGSSDELPDTPGGQPHSPDEAASSPGERKKNHLKRPKGKDGPSPADAGGSHPTDDDNWVPHPAIQAVKAVTGFYPRKVLYQQVINCLGEEPDLEKLQRVYTLWVANGYNPMNLSGWLLDWYPSEMIQTDRGILMFRSSGPSWVSPQTQQSR